jgi:cytochrome c oxidase cbb3-type subunit I/II
MVVSLMLWAPSWGGMLNGLLTLRGAWNKVREDPVLKFFVAGVTFYGMATFEGPMLSIKSVSALAHYTDWIIGHVHSGALGWNGFMAAGMFYFLVPRLFGTQLHSKKAADAHFWIGLVGIILYIVAMWISGINQGLMLRAVSEDGALTYPSWVETLIAIRPLYIVRFLGGTLYLFGFVLMAWNLVKTARAGKAVDGTAEVTVDEQPDSDGAGLKDVILGQPLWFSVFLLAAAATFVFAPLPIAVGSVVAVGVIAKIWWEVSQERKAAGRPTWFAVIERRSLWFAIFTLLAVLVGGIAELLPTILVKQAVPATGAAQKRYTALELQGRDLYVREGCYTCHSQMVRPLGPEAQRFGEPSRAEEFIYDHPFQWGSKRTGPDLHRVGGRFPSLWHYTHLMDPRSTSPGSNMPAYAWLEGRVLDVKLASKKLQLMQKLGVPYTNAEIDDAEKQQRAQGEAIAADLAGQGVAVSWDREIVAMIAYLQRLGRDQGVPFGPKPLETAQTGGR